MTSINSESGYGAGRAGKIWRNIKGQSKLNFQNNRSGRQGLKRNDKGELPYDSHLQFLSD